MDRRRWWERARASRHRRVLGRYVVGSGASTAISQVVLTIAYALSAGVAVASALAYVAGIPVNYLLQRRWTWGTRRGGPRLVRYLVTVGASAVVVVGLTSLLEALVTTTVSDRTLQVVLVNVVFLGVNGVVFLAKYVLFDQVVFRDAHPAPTDAPTAPAPRPEEG